MRILQHSSVKSIWIQIKYTEYREGSKDIINLYLKVILRLPLSAHSTAYGMVLLVVNDLKLLGLHGISY